MWLLVLVALVLVVGFATRPFATSKALVQVVLFSAAALAVVMIQIAGPEPVLVGAAVIAGGLWLLIVLLAPRARRMAW